MDSRDFISSLPDDILGKILCLLPTRLAVPTSVLSKRWRNLLLLVDNFDLEDSATSSDNGFSNFMEQTISLSKNTCPIKRLSLNCGGDYDKSSVERWIRTFERGCLELHLQSQCGHSLDIGIFSSSNTLVKFTLSDGIDVDGDVPPEGTVFFPALKTLSLGSVVAIQNRMTGSSLVAPCLVLHVPAHLFDDVFGSVTNLVAGKRYVKTLHLSPDSLEISFVSVSRRFTSAVVPCRCSTASVIYLLRATRKKDGNHCLFSLRTLQIYKLLL